MRKTLFAALEARESDAPEDLDILDYMESCQNLQHLDLMQESLSLLESIRTDLLEQETISAENYQHYLSAYQQFKDTFRIPETAVDNMAMESASGYRAALERAGETHLKLMVSMEGFIGSTFHTIGNGFVFMTSFFTSYEKKIYNIRQLLDGCPAGTASVVEFRASNEFSYRDGKVCKDINEYKAQLRLSVDNLKTLIKNFDDFVTHNGIFSRIRSWISYLRSKEGEMKFLGPYLDTFKEVMKLVELHGMREANGNYVSDYFLGEWHTAVYGYEKFKQANNIYLEKGETTIELKAKHMRSLLARVEFFVDYESGKPARGEVVFKNVSKKDLTEIYEIVKDLGESIDEMKRIGNKFRTFYNGLEQLLILSSTIQTLVVVPVLFSLLFARTGLVTKTAVLVNVSIGNLLKISGKTVRGVEHVVQQTVREIK